MAIARVSFASGVTILGGEPPLPQSPDILIHAPVCPDITEEDQMDILSVETDVPIPVLHPGFGHFHGRGRSGGRPVTRICLTFQRSSLAGFRGHMGDSRLIRHRYRFHQSFRVVWLIQLWPLWFRPGRSRALRPSVIATQTVVDALPIGMDSVPDVVADSSSTDAHSPFSGSPVGAVADIPNNWTGRVGCRSPRLIPRWWLAREGPFLEEHSSSSLRCLGAGCAFRNTTYRPSDYVLLSGEFGIPLHHPRFLEWIGVPESAGVLEMGPWRWLHLLTRDQAMASAIQLHRDVCFMATNLDDLDQYALSLQGTASKILELGLDSRGFPSEEVASAV